MELPQIDLTGVPLRREMRPEQYFGLWAVECQRFAQLLGYIQNINLAAHVESAGPIHEAPLAVDGAGYDRQMEAHVTPGGTAVIQVSGTLTKYGSSFSTRGSTLRIRRAVNKAAQSSKVENILLLIDSPGGSVSGIDDLARAVAAANEKKPVVAYAEDLMASAAYYIGSQAGAIYANHAAEVGSIGVFAYLYDMSRAAANAGIRPIVVKSGEFKGAGISGTEIREEDVAEIQRMVDSTAEDFIQAVMSGRKMDREQAESLATGRVWRAGEAVELGLVDRVRTLDAVLEEMERSATGSRGKGLKSASTRPAEEQKKQEDVMSDNPIESGSEQQDVAAQDQPVTAADLESACPKADASFIVEQLKSGASVEQAKSAYIDQLLAERDQAQTVQDAKAQAPAGLELSSTPKPVNAQADLEDQIRQEMKNGLPRHEAARKVFAKNRELREQFVAEMN